MKTKKIVAILLVTILAFTACSALATDEMSALMLNVLINKIGENEEVTFLFDTRASRAYVDDEGDVMVRLESNLSWSFFNLNPDSSLEMVQQMWKSFHNVHSELSIADLYLSIHYKRDILYFTGGSVIIDYNENLHFFKDDI